MDFLFNDKKDLLCSFCRTRVVVISDSKDWHHAGKDKSLRCTQCRLYYKRHGEERPLDSPEDPPFLFKPVKEDPDALGGRHNMRTRQSRETVGTVPLDLIDFCCLYQNFEVNWDFYVQI